MNWIGRMRREGERWHCNETSKDHVRVKTHNKIAKRTRFAGRCRRPRCRGCRYPPADKSMKKIKGQHKALSMDVTSNHRMDEWSVWKHFGKDLDDGDENSEKEDCSYSDEDFYEKPGHAEKDLHRADAGKSITHTDSDAPEEGGCAFAGEDFATQNGRAEKESRCGAGAMFMSNQKSPAKEGMLVSQTKVEPFWHGIACYAEQSITPTADEVSEEEDRAHANEEFSIGRHSRGWKECASGAMFTSYQTSLAEEESFVSQTKDDLSRKEAASYAEQFITQTAGITQDRGFGGDVYSYTDEESIFSTDHTAEESCFVTDQGAMSRPADETSVSPADAQLRQKGQVNEKFRNPTGHADEEFHSAALDESTVKQDRCPEEECINSHGHDIDELINADWYKIGLSDAASQSESDDDWSLCSQV